MRVKPKLIYKICLFYLILQFALFSLSLAVEKPLQIQEEGYTSSLVCGQCHEAIYSKWKNSMHAMSFSDPIFEMGYMRAVNDLGEDIRARCLSCHAPVTRFNNDLKLKDPVTREGVTCDFCHTIKGINPQIWTDFYQLLAGVTKYGPLKEAKPLVHQVEPSELFTKSEFCAGCHEMKSDNGLTIMGTYTEWKETSYASEGVQCQNCHMPLTEGPVVRPEVKESQARINLHDLQGGHSVAQLAKAIKVEILDIISAPQGLNVRVGITNIGSGHFVPTGHPARQLVLRLSVKNSKGNVVHHEEKIFKKTLVDKDGMELKYKHEFLKAVRVLMDNRIPPKKRQDETFFIPKSVKSQGTVEVKLFYRFTPEVIQTQEMLIEMGGDNKVIR